MNEIKIRKCFAATVAYLIVVLGIEMGNKFILAVRFSNLGCLPSIIFSDILH